MYIYIPHTHTHIHLHTKMKFLHRQKVSHNSTFLPSTFHIHSRENSKQQILLRTFQKSLNRILPQQERKISSHQRPPPPVLLESRVIDRRRRRRSSILINFRPGKMFNPKLKNVFSSSCRRGLIKPCTRAQVT